MQTLLAVLAEHLLDTHTKRERNGGGGGGFLFWEDRGDDGEGEEDAKDEDPEWRADPSEVLAAFWDGLIALRGPKPALGESEEEEAQEEGGEGSGDLLPASEVPAASGSAIARNLVAMCCDCSATHVVRALLCLLQV